MFVELVFPFCEVDMDEIEGKLFLVEDNCDAASGRRLWRPVEFENHSESADLKELAG